MTADEFVKIVRSGSEKLRVDEIVLKTGTQEFHGKGMLRISREEIKLDMTLDEGENPPAIQFGVHTKSDYWKLNGVIEDVLQFKCDYISFGNSQHFFNWNKCKNVLKLDLSPIELIPSGSDALTREERAQLHKELLQKNKNIANQNREAGNTEPPTETSAYFYALILNYPVPTLACAGTEIIEKNPYFGERRSGKLDTLKGEIGNYNYAFIKEKDDGDIHVHLESKKGYHSSSTQEDWDKFYALMHALAFMQGMHAWPYRIEYWRDGQKITDRVTSARRLAHTVHIPFRLLKFDFQDVVKKTTTFLEVKTKLSEEILRILFLFREATDYEFVHGEIALITLCVLFETLVNQLFKELKLEEKVRELGIEKITMKERLKAVATHFCLPWQGDMEVIFKTWQKVRDPLIHGNSRANQSETESKDSMIAESQIAGAMNILFLKLFGYSGKMCASAFEDKYRQI